jgi:predicted ribosome quality control (RQC) complex YloA/Tae2 family protein
MISLGFNDFNIMVGQNKHENDYILKKSSQNDIWFHLANLPSCHVVLFTNNRKVDKHTLTQCAHLVKDNTKFKNFHKIKVEYITMKYIKRTHELGKVLLLKKTQSLII